MLSRDRHALRRASVGTLCAFALAGTVAVGASAATGTGTATPAAAAEQQATGRAVISTPTEKGNVVSWRLLSTDGAGTAFQVYRDGEAVGSPVDGATTFLDTDAADDATYTVVPASAGSGAAQASVRAVADSLTFTPVAGAEAGSLDVPLDRPAGGSTPSGSFTYAANDASVGDLDGDGEYEIVLKWDPSNSKDNSQSGYTGNVLLDAYELDGTRLWRIDLGRNVRAGAHYTQFQVYDYDGDGSDEVALRTSDGTVSGTGQVIGSASADHRNSSGYVLSGPEFLTVFRGTDGAELDSADFAPARGSVGSWGDTYGNRVDRFLAGTAYLDGSRPSIVMGRGYYARSAVSAWDFRGGELTRRWTFDSSSSTNGPDWTGRGNHQLSVADVDSDGRDEILYGSMAIDDDGSGLWQNGTHHGDSYHVSDLVPSNPGLEVFKPSESGSDPAHWVADARTGRILSSADPVGSDNGRGVAADVTASNPGAEVWSSAVSQLRSATDNSPVGRKPGSTNFVIWWDGDGQRELLDGTHIDEYGESGDTRLLTGSDVSSNNGTKSTPALQADILGDWREEVIWRTSDNSALRIYTSTIPTSISHPSLMEDHQYRMAVAWQNSAYNQPPHASFATVTGSATPSPTPTASEEPSDDPSNEPSDDPSNEPSDDPSDEPSDDPSDEPTGEPADARCAASYEVVGRWQGGFQAQATLVNTGDEPMTSWELTWEFTGGETVQQGWGGGLTQSGTTVTATAPGWHTDLAPGESASVGIIGSGTPAAVTAMSAGDQECTVS
ncbi:cellulose binding domain-containing protein [Isoptericola jiangsuensis]|uniref:rhamnogalacturonan lyase family protein n=1 Tax=Isoptericola jiangsuensis TaxID=548579 RepID=UPI003AAC1652